MFRYGLFGLVVALLAVILAAPAALAQNPHFVVGPTFSIVGDDQVRATGDIAGLGHENITVVLTADLEADLICTNPAGNIAPGQTQEITVTGEDTDIEVKNGKAAFDVTTDAPELVGTPRQLGCPNNKWTPSIANVTILSALLEVFQGGELVLSEEFTP